jgi:hypothetical protein
VRGLVGEQLLQVRFGAPTGARIPSRY